MRNSSAVDLNVKKKGAGGNAFVVNSRRVPEPPLCSFAPCWRSGIPKKRKALIRIRTDNLSLFLKGELIDLHVLSI